MIYNNLLLIYYNLGVSAPMPGASTRTTRAGTWGCAADAGLVGAGCERGPDCKSITFYLKSYWKFTYFGKLSRVEAVKKALRREKQT